MLVSHFLSTSKLAGVYGKWDTRQGACSPTLCKAPHTNEATVYIIAALNDYPLYIDVFSVSSPLLLFILAPDKRK